MTVQTEGMVVADSAFVTIQDIARSGGRDIIDIRRDREEISLLKDIRDGLNPKGGGEKRLPTLLLYDEAGLKLFEDITYLDEYYLTNAEIELLHKSSDKIAQHIAPGSIIVELGSGNLRKIDILLKAIDRRGKAVEYYALDLSLPELERTLAAVPKGWYNHVQCFGLHGTYDDGLEWLQRTSIKSKPKTILSLGSSVGNFSRKGAGEFLKGFVDIMEDADRFLIAIDGCDDGDRIFHAYNDRHGTTHKFIANGLKHANRTLEKEVFDAGVWHVLGEYNKEAGRHQAFVYPSEDTLVDGILVKQGEKVRIEESHKYSPGQIEQLWRAAGVSEKVRWTNDTKGYYALHMIAKRNYAFDWAPQQYAPGPVPTWDDWNHLWALWDAVTREMIPDESLLDKPIKLRNACIFYLGHIPTFFDIKITESTNEAPTDPVYFRQIFERGIDPDVDNPEQCHAHSEIPNDWPPLEEILTFQERVRQRVQSFYELGTASEPNIARALWLGYEHEAMHLETLLYMLVQSDRTLPPPRAPQPNFHVLAEQARKLAVPNEWIKIPESGFNVGLEDPETTIGSARYFGWDVEKPMRRAHVAAFEAKARPITVGEYAAYLETTKESSVPASWSEINSNGHADGYIHGTLGDSSNGVGKLPSSTFLKNKAVRSVYGNIPLKDCLDWPVSASYDELAGCAKWMGGRIPTFEEVRSIYTYVDDQQKNSITNNHNAIPAVNGHLVNDGVQESPPSKCHQSNGDHLASLNPNAIFTDLKGANVGFQHWHPVPVTAKGNKLCGQGDFGGLWEWTASPLAKFEGYSPMPLYPAFSQDFFDDKHNVVLGGSWATVPRLAGRKSFVNWYQRNYPYVWAGARVVRDLQEQ